MFTRLKAFVDRILLLTYGRCTAFFVIFLVSGHVMIIFGALTPTYIKYMGTLGGLVLGHSIKEDVMARFGAGQDAPPMKGAPDADDNP